MTLAELATFITQKVGDTSSSAVALAKEFVKARYRMLWDAHPWRDIVTDELGPSVSGVSDYQVDGIDRILSVRFNATAELLRLDHWEVVRLYPSGVFSEQGTPKYYVPLPAVSGDAAVRLVPTPNVVQTINVWGCRTFVPLSADGDSPLILGCDNALLAYAQGDILERQRHYEKAKLKFQEGAEQLALLRATNAAWQIPRPAMPGPEPAKA